MPTKILVVEDEDSLRHALKDKLMKEGFEVLEAQDGEEGLKMAIEQVPNLILLDILMPKMDGLSMLKKFREHDLENKVPVILLSNLSELTGISEALALGAKEYLVKSNWKLDDLVAKVKEKSGKV